MHLIDTHTHLFTDAFVEDRTEVVERAIAMGVTPMLLPNIDASTIPAVLDLYQQYPGHCLPMLGLHPCSVKADFEEQLQRIEKAVLETEGLVGIGEMGLDLYWDKTFFEEQQTAFRIQAGWAIQKGLPLSIHSRDAQEHTIALLTELHQTGLTGVQHCFVGSYEQGMQLIEMGFKLGIGGVVTYKKAGLAETVARLPLEGLVLETDAPYLPPHPHRGKRNESAYLTLIAQKVAEAKNCSLEKVAKTCTLTAKEVFGL